MIQQAEESYSNTLFLADVSGCSFYRMRVPYWALQYIAKNIRIIESQQIIDDQNFYKTQRTIHIQRQVSDQQSEFILKYLRPLTQHFGTYIRYEVDDVIFHEDIPPYNIGRKAFDNANFYHNVTNILNAVDFMTVTTEGLKNYYVTKCGLNPNKVIVIPNYLPRWWIGEAYDVNKKKLEFNKYKNRPRILLPLSTSHYDVEGINGYKDDFSVIANLIRKTCKKYEWIVVGHIPKLIEDLIADRKVTVCHGSDILNYPRETAQREIQLIVAPLQDNVFNRNKSAIKLWESWSLGIPAIVQDLPCYNQYTDSLFKDENELQNKIDETLRDVNKYMKIVKQNRHIIDYGDKNNPNGLWIEKNLQKWYDVFSLPQRTLALDIRTPKQQVVNNNGVNIQL